MTTPISARKRPLGLTLLGGWTLLVGMLAVGTSIALAVGTPSAWTSFLPAFGVGVVLLTLGWITWKGRNYYGSLIGYVLLALVAIALAWTTRGNPAMLGALLMGVLGALAVASKKGRAYFDDAPYQPTD